MAAIKRETSLSREKYRETMTIADDDDRDADDDDDDGCR